MAVYTKVSAEQIDEFLRRYDVGDLKSVKGIAEGVENSNYLVETSQEQFILTLYEKRTDPKDLPFFFDMLDHLSQQGCPVPPAIKDRAGQRIQEIAGRKACLIQFLPGVSVSAPHTGQAASVGRALADMHNALADYPGERPNALNQKSWSALARQCGRDALNGIEPGLADIIDTEIDFLEEYWPRNLPKSVIHADLFPDNVLMLGDDVTAMIDFYFSCTDIKAYDLAITHLAWCFSEDGATLNSDISDALLSAYDAHAPLSSDEKQALPILARGAAMRFLLTRSYDWINTPADAMVMRKDPISCLNRLRQYQTMDMQGFFPA